MKNKINYDIYRSSSNKAIEELDCTIRERTFVVDFSTTEMTWATTAVSDDVLDGSIKAVADGCIYKLIFQNEKPHFAFLTGMSR